MNPPSIIHILIPYKFRQRMHRIPAFDQLHCLRSGKEQFRLSILERCRSLFPNQPLPPAFLQGVELIFGQLRIALLHWELRTLLLEHIAL